MAFEARYHGRCSCGEPIIPGQTVHYAPSGMLLHIDCHYALEGEDPATVKSHEEQCQDCFLIHPKGECP